MKNKYARKTKEDVKKSKTPKNSKKIISRKKQARRSVVKFDKSLPENLPPGQYHAQINAVDAAGEKVTLGFESFASDPIEPEALVDLAADVIPGDPTEAV